jgi:hypothetical protein
MTCVSMSATTTTNGTPSNQRMTGILASIGPTAGLQSSQQVYKNLVPSRWSSGGTFAQGDIVKPLIGTFTRSSRYNAQPFQFPKE